MSIDIKIQAKTAEILASEAAFYSVNPAAVAKAIHDKVVAGGLTREVLTGVDVDSYRVTRPGRRRGTGDFEFEGRLRSIAFISEQTGIPAHVIRSRLRRGWPMERAARSPLLPKGFQKKRAAA